MPINKDTKIEFSLGMLFTTVGSVISIFIGFYFMVQKPNNDSVKEQMNTQFELREKYLEDKFKNIDEKLTGFSSGITNLNAQVGELSKRDNADAQGSQQVNEGGF